MEDVLWKVYAHVNKINNKIYIGITSKKNVNHRWNSGRGYKENPHFSSAIEEYGWDGFEHLVLRDDLDEERAKQMEVALIKTLDTNNPEHGYNMTTGGDGTPGYNPSEETRAKLSEARRKENLSEETLRRRSEGLTGRKFSDEHKRKIGKANSRPVNMLDKDGRLIRQFTSMTEAEQMTGILHSHISQCCNGQRMTSGGYCWEYA